MAAVPHKCCRRKLLFVCHL